MGKNTLNNAASASSGNSKAGILRNPYLRYIIFGVVICLLPLLAKSGIMPSSFLVNLGGVIIYSVVALGLNLLLGYSGLISLGTAGFMGMGAYISWLSDRECGAALPAGAVYRDYRGRSHRHPGRVRLPARGRHLPGHATLCVSEILRKTFEELDQFTNGFFRPDSQLSQLLRPYPQP